MPSKSKKQTRKSVSMPGYVYDAYQIACEQAGVPVAAQTERLVRAWLAEQTGVPVAAPSRPQREPKAKPEKSAKAPKPPKTTKKARKAKAADDAPPADTSEVQAKEPPPVVSEEATPDGVLMTYADGMQVEHLDTPTEEMEDSADPAAEDSDEEYEDDRVIVTDDLDLEFADVGGDGEHVGG